MTKIDTDGQRDRLVTPEMQKAGVDSIERLDGEYWESNRPEFLAEFVTGIYKAMERARVQRERDSASEGSRS